MDRASATPCRRAALASALVLTAALAPPAQAARKYAVTVLGGDEASFVPKSTAAAALDPRRYDAVVIGGGISGLTAAYFLTESSKTVLLLEKEPELGGLAFGGATHAGVKYDRGTAYWTDAYDEERRLLDKLGLEGYQKTDAIHEPSDSYLLRGKLYLGLWEDRTVQELPASFELFRYELRRSEKDQLVPNQPIEEAPKLDLDLMSAAEWVRAMPELVRRRAASDPEAERILGRFQSDPKVPRTDPMKDVLDLADLYSRSALGTTTENLSALAFANFYISEITTRFTTPIGTGKAARRLEDLLKARPDLADVRTRAAAARVRDLGDRVRVSYLHAGAPREVEAGYAVLAGQIGFAPRLVEGLAEAEPARAALMSGLEYSHVAVHVVFTKGHPYRATYDTWTRPADYGEEDFTDVILGRWMDPAIRGYEGLRDFSKEPPDDDGILTIYHPLSKRWVGSGYTRAQAEGLARRAVARLQGMFKPVLEERWKSRVEVRSVETNRWPFSLHVARPGHFSRKARFLRRPFGRVFFAHSNIGTPSFEEALFRGHCAADNALSRLDPAFRYEPWTLCPRL